MALEAGKMGKQAAEAEEGEILDRETEALKAGKMRKLWMGETEAMEAENGKTVSRETEAEEAVERKSEDVGAADGWGN